MKRQKIDYGLILGSGATAQTTAYVLYKLNIIPIIYNRSQNRLN